MILDKGIKYKDLLIFALIAIVGWKLIDNYEYFFDMLGKLYGIISPFIYAAAFAYMLNPIVKFFHKKLKLKKGLAILITYLIVVGLITIAVIFVVPNLIDSIISLSSDIPSYMKKVQKFVNNLMNNDKISNVIYDLGLDNYLTDLSSTLGDVMLKVLNYLATSIFSIATNIIKVLLGFLISIYVLIDKEKIIIQTKVLINIIFKEKLGSNIVRVISVYNKMIGSYVGIKAIDSIIIGVIAFIGLTILRAPYAVIIALVVMVTNMIPYFGPLVGELVGAFIGIFQSPGMAFMILVYLLAVQQFDAWFLDPKLVGNKVGVSPLVLIFAVTLGGGIAGALGMLLASPTAATIKIFYDKKIEKYKQKHPEEVMDEDEIIEENKKEEKKK